MVQFVYQSCRLRTDVCHRQLLGAHDVADLGKRFQPRALFEVEKLESERRNLALPLDDQFFDCWRRPKFDPLVRLVPTEL
jgi:hypothetical protein